MTDSYSCYLFYNLNRLYVHSGNWRILIHTLFILLPRDIGNRLCNVLMYFFPEGKMHVADIIKIPYMLATNEGLAKYAVESRRDGKLEEKAG